MTTTFKLNWKRNPDTGNWAATDSRDGTRYIAGRSERHSSSRPNWQLTAALPAPDTTTQYRSGFSSLKTAQHAALNSRCARCSRIVPFGSLEETGRNDWRTCRDRTECAAIEAAREAEAQRVHREIRDTPWQDASVRDTPDGPELVIDTSGGTRTTVQCTGPDLARLRAVLARRAGTGVEYTVLSVSPLGYEEPLSSGHFPAGGEYFPGEEAARDAATGYARKLHDGNAFSHFIVRRAETEVVWDGTP